MCWIERASGTITNPSRSRAKAIETEWWKYHGWIHLMPRSCRGCCEISWGLSVEGDKRRMSFHAGPPNGFGSCGGPMYCVGTGSFAPRPGTANDDPGVSLKERFDVFRCFKYSVFFNICFFNTVLLGFPKVWFPALSAVGAWQGGPQQTTREQFVRIYWWNPQISIDQGLDSKSQSGGEKRTEWVQCIYLDILGLFWNFARWTQVVETAYSIVAISTGNSFQRHVADQHMGDYREMYSRQCFIVWFEHPGYKRPSCSFGKLIRMHWSTAGLCLHSCWQREWRDCCFVKGLVQRRPLTSVKLWCESFVVFNLHGLGALCFCKQIRLPGRACQGCLALMCFGFWCFLLFMQRWLN